MDQKQRERDKKEARARDRVIAASKLNRLAREWKDANKELCASLSRTTRMLENAQDYLNGARIDGAGSLLAIADTDVGVIKAQLHELTAIHGRLVDGLRDLDEKYGDGIREKVRF